jgi:putative membrane protein
MQRLTRAGLSLILALSVVSCGSTRPANDVTNPPTGRDIAAVGTAGAAADRKFIVDQLETATAEINLGRIATERATHPDVKEFAAAIVRDYEAAADRLRKVASAANVPVDLRTEPDGDRKRTQAELAKLSGSEFDGKYIDAMIKELEDAVEDLRYADAESAEVRQWVTLTVSKARQHLEKAKQIQEALRGTRARTSSNQFSTT